MITIQLILSKSETLCHNRTNPIPWRNRVKSKSELSLCRSAWRNHEHAIDARTCASVIRVGPLSLTIAVLLDLLATRLQK